MITREYKPMRDYEVMELVLNRGDAVELARLLSVSPQLVRAWCRQPETEEEYATGKFGPLARLRTLIHMIREEDGKPDRAYPIGQYVANLLSGTFVPDPHVGGNVDADAMSNISAVLRETSDVVETFRRAWFEKTPRKINGDEQAEINTAISEAIASLVILQRFVGR